MEEQKRYEVKRLDYSLNVKLVDNNEPDWRYIIFDSVNDEELAKLETVCDWLNQKDKQIKELEEYIKTKENCNEWLTMADNENLQKENQQLKEKLAEKDQDKISFCIEQLEKVKELCREKFNWWENSEWEGNIYDKSDVSNAYFDIEANIEEQINELNEGVKNE